MALTSACLVVGVVGMVQIARLCALEAALGTRVVRLVMGDSYHPPASPLVFYPVGDERFRALEITWQCSSILAATPILVLAALASWLPSARPRALAGCAVAGLVVVAAANQARLLVIALATARWGDDGFEVAHRIVGSGIVLLSVVVAAAAIVRARPRPRSRRHGAERG